MKTQADLISAVARFRSQVEIARLVKTSPSMVYQWCTGKRPVPITYGPAIERELGISRRHLFPDQWREMWPEMPDQAANDAPPPADQAGPDGQTHPTQAG